MFSTLPTSKNQIPSLTQFVVCFYECRSPQTYWLKLRSVTSNVEIVKRLIHFGLLLVSFFAFQRGSDNKQVLDFLNINFFKFCSRLKVRTWRMRLVMFVVQSANRNRCAFEGLKMRVWKGKRKIEHPYFSSFLILKIWNKKNNNFKHFLISVGFSTEPDIDTKKTGTKFLQNCGLCSTRS